MDHDTTEATVDEIDADITSGDGSETADARSMDAIYQKARVARDKLNMVINDLGEKADHAEKRVRSGMAQTETRIKDNPFAAVGLAAGLGVIVGLLLNRRH